ncbi:uncharacterized protein LOC134773386 [Penaeus indicus]|uniref:uncharacterized protein LOC134773386 n=1 Tax=Penaeus indicus TaxID=29960 RepID=UPI00300C6829
MKAVRVLLLLANLLFFVDCALNESLPPIDRLWDPTPFLTRYVRLERFYNVHVLRSLNESLSPQCERWWQLTYVKLLKNQKTAFLASSSLTDLVGRRASGAYSEVVVALLLTDSDFQVLDEVSLDRVGHASLMK